MKTSWIWLLGLTLVVAMLGLGAACDSGGDDDDDDGGATGAEIFCNKLDKCGLFGLIDVATADQCLLYVSSGQASAVGGCVVDAANCDAVEACFDTGDDDDDDDDVTDDDDDDDDDDDTAVDSAPQLRTPSIFLAADNLSSIIWNETSNFRNFGTQELIYLHVDVVDEGCDLAGGKMYYRLDGGPDTEYATIPSNIDCTDNEAGQAPSVGYRLDEIPGALDAGKASHQFTFWWVDANGNVSNEKAYSYQADDYDTAIGGQMTAFPHEPLTDKDGNEVYLSDFEDQVVVINSFAMW